MCAEYSPERNKFDLIMDRLQMHENSAFPKVKSLKVKQGGGVYKIGQLKVLTLGVLPGHLSIIMGK